MWTSVPQIDATFTRIRTSVGPGDGIGTVRISVLFGAGFDFTAAFIVDAIPNSPRRACSWTLGISTFYHSLRSVSRSDVPEHGRTDLKIPASEDEALPANRAHHQLCLRVSVEEAEDRRLVHILGDCLPSDDGVDPEQGLLDPKRGCDPLNRGARP